MKTRKMLAILLVLALTCALLPAAALAEGASSVTVNGVELNSTTPYLVNGAGTATSDTPASDDGYAHFAAGTSILTLNNYSGGAIAANGDLTITLSGNNVVTANDTYAIRVGTGTSPNGNLTITGTGKLTATAIMTCILVFNDAASIRITGGITVAARSTTSGTGIYGKAGVTIEGSTVTAEGKNDGISTLTNGGTITITNSTVKAIGSTAALSKAPTLTYSNDNYSWKAGNTIAEPEGAFTNSAYTYNGDHKFFGIIPGNGSGTPFTVTYDDNGATSGHAGGDTSYSVTDTSFTLPTTAPYRRNFSFDGWKVTTAAMFGTGFELNEVYTASQTDLDNAYGNVTLTAQWSDLTPPPTPDAPSITTQPTDQSVTEGQRATFSVTARGIPAPSYKWEISSDGVIWTEITTATSSSYTTDVMPLSANGYQYRALYPTALAAQRATLQR